MRYGQFLSLALPLCAFASALYGATENEPVRNSRVTVVEYTIGPGETLAMEGAQPAVTVYLDSGTLAQGDEFAMKTAKVERGHAVFSQAGARTFRNPGTAPLRFVRVEFHGSGSGRVWGTTGLAPAYKLLLENIYTRVYDIRIPARENEPQHTHHDRVVICLSGAKLKHVLADGQEETATLQTGEIVWRQGATHEGHNLGDTDLWVIAVEPK